MALNRASRTAMSRLLAPCTRAPGAQTTTMTRRGLATHEPQVSWAEYREGKKTLAEWVEANRHVVAGGFFVMYVGLAVWNFRPGKKKGNAGAQDAEPAAGAEHQA